ncbi:hypothetical protein [Polaromonas sp. P5_D5]
MTHSFFSAGIITLMVLGFTPAAHAQFGTASGNYENDLGQLFGAAQTLGAIKDLCAEEFPEHKAKNEAAYAAWRARSAPLLQEVESNMSAMIERETKGDQAKADAFRALLDQKLVDFKANQRRTVFVGDPARARERCAAYPALIGSPAWNFEKSMAGHVAVMRKGPVKP